MTEVKGGCTVASHRITSALNFSVCLELIMQGQVIVSLSAVIPTPSPIPTDPHAIARLTGRAGSMKIFFPSLIFYQRIFALLPTILFINRAM